MISSKLEPTIPLTNDSTTITTGSGSASSASSSQAHTSAHAYALGTVKSNNIRSDESTIHKIAQSPTLAHKHFSISPAVLAGVEEVRARARARARARGPRLGEGKGFHSAKDDECEDDDESDKTEKDSWFNSGDGNGNGHEQILRRTNAAAAAFAVKTSTSTATSVTIRSTVTPSLELLRPLLSRLPSSHPATDHSSTPSSHDRVATSPNLSTETPYLPSHPLSPLDQVLYTNSRLPRIDNSSFELWSAFHGFRPIVEDYADGYLSSASSSFPSPQPSQAKHDISPLIPEDHPLISSAALQLNPTCPFLPSSSQRSSQALSHISRVFNWSSLVLPLEITGEWYGVIFRSVRKVLPSDQSLEFSKKLYEFDFQSHEEAVDSGGLLLYWYGTPSLTTGANLATCIWTSREDAIKASGLPLHRKAERMSRGAYEKYELTRYRVVKMEGERTVRLESWGDV